MPGRPFTSCIRFRAGPSVYYFNENERTAWRSLASSLQGDAACPHNLFGGGACKAGVFQHLNRTGMYALDGERTTCISRLVCKRVHDPPGASVLGRQHGTPSVGPRSFPGRFGPASHSSSVERGRPCRPGASRGGASEPASLDGVREPSCPDGVLRVSVRLEAANGWRGRPTGCCARHSSRDRG